MPLIIGQTFAGYRILQLLGSGGMGEVYLADHPRLPRRDALKILRSDVSEGDDQYRQRFIQEADLAGKLWHPNIVRVNDRGEDDGRLWIAMDFIDGTDAAHLLRGQPGGLPPRQVLDIVTAVADALDYAHDNGLLHRDVKPANILLTDPARGTQRVLLADFGIARQLGDPRGLTATNMTLGTVSYSAPEQLIGGPIDGRADQYAMAATAFDLLSGTPPFQDSNPAVVIGQHLHSPPPRLSSRRPDLATLDEPLVRALAKDPKQRFGSCKEFAAALTRAAAVSSETFDARGFAAAAGGPRDTPLPNPPATAPIPDDGQAVRVRRLTPLVVALLGALAVGVAVLIGVLLARNSAPGPAALQASPSSSPPVAAPSPPPVTVTVSASTSSPVPVPAPPSSAPMVLQDADIHGFINYNGAARCDGYDRAVVILRTTKSALVVCQSAGGAHYRGLRLSDGATITLADITVDNSGGQVIVTNPADGTRYLISRQGLDMVRNGALLDSEPAVEFATP